MDIKDILGALEIVKSVAGPLAAIGVPGAGFVSSALEVAENLKARIDEGKVIVSGGDRAEVDRLLEELRAENDKLAQQIANS